MLEGEFIDVAHSPSSESENPYQLDLEDEDTSFFHSDARVLEVSEKRVDHPSNRLTFYKSFAHILFPEYQKPFCSHVGDTLDHLLDMERRIMNLVKSIPTRSPEGHDLAIEKLLGPPQHDSGLSLLEILIYEYSNNSVQDILLDPAVEWIIQNTSLQSLGPLLRPRVPALQQFQFDLLREEVLTGRMELVKHLLQVDTRLADTLQLQCHKSERLLFAAINSGRQEMLELLWNVGGPRAFWHTKTWWRSSTLAGSNLSVATAKFLASKGVNLPATYRRIIGGLLLGAVEKGNIELVRFFLSIEKDINKWRGAKDCLSQAASSGDSKLLHLLLDHNPPDPRSFAYYSGS